MLSIDVYKRQPLVWSMTYHAQPNGSRKQVLAQLSVAMPRATAHSSKLKLFNFV